MKLPALYLPRGLAGVVLQRRDGSVESGIAQSRMQAVQLRIAWSSAPRGALVSSRFMPPARATRLRPPAIVGKGELRH